MAGTVQETTCSSEIVRRSGRRFLERGCILERQIFRDAKMILRDSAALRMTSPHCFVAGGYFRLCTELSLFEGSQIDS